MAMNPWIDNNWTKWDDTPRAKLNCGCEADLTPGKMFHCKDPINHNLEDFLVYYDTRKKSDTVNNPSHYNKHGVECIQAIEASMSEEEFQGYLKGNFEKYVWRYKYKGKPLEDLKKAQWYLNKLIERIKSAS